MNEARSNHMKQLFAQYRARVHEACFRTLSDMGQKPFSEASLAKPTILVIEDNLDEWFLIRNQLFSRFPQAECHWLTDAAQVESYLDQYAQTGKELPRLILLDLYLPSAQKGLQVLQSIKSHYLFGSISAVVFSRSADPVDIAQAFACLANAYLIKPTSSTQWLTVFAELEPYWHQADTNNQRVNKP